ncbi:MAG: AAA family ATPase, partial [Candidatus Bathyarchaeia archaeon]
MEREVRLQVAEVKQQRDVGRCKARIGSKIMEKLEISTGDIIEIKGKKVTAAIAWPAYDEDAGRNIIRIDGITRQNASVSINEYVTVRKANAKDAQHITLAPLNVTIPNVDEGFYEFIRTRIIEIPVVEDNVIQVPIFGNPVYFRVVKTRPHGIVRISPNTGIQILSEPLPEKKGIARVTYEDVGGLQEEIQRVREMVELPLKHPELFQR